VARWRRLTILARSHQGHHASESSAQHFSKLYRADAQEARWPQAAGLGCPGRFSGIWRREYSYEIRASRKGRTLQLVFNLAIAYALRSVEDLGGHLPSLW